jgi:hypothetical protein
MCLQGAFMVGFQSCNFIAAIFKIASRPQPAHPTDLQPARNGGGEMLWLRKHQLPAADDLAIDAAQLLFGQRLPDLICSKGIDGGREPAPESVPLRRSVFRLGFSFEGDDAHGWFTRLLFCRSESARYRI